MESAVGFPVPFSVHTCSGRGGRETNVTQSEMQYLCCEKERALSSPATTCVAAGGEIQTRPFLLIGSLVAVFISPVRHLIFFPFFDYPIPGSPFAIDAKDPSGVR